MRIAAAIPAQWQTHHSSRRRIACRGRGGGGGGGLDTGAVFYFVPGDNCMFFSTLR